MAFTRDDVEVLTRNLTDYQGEAWLIHVADRYFAISAIRTTDNRRYDSDETVAFMANDQGAPVFPWPVAVVSSWDHEAAIYELLETLPL